MGRWVADMQSLRERERERRELEHWRGIIGCVVAVVAMVSPTWFWVWSPFIVEVYVWKLHRLSVALTLICHVDWSGVGSTTSSWR
jgi:hypothetical protein